MLVTAGHYSFPVGGVGAMQQNTCSVGSYCAGGVQLPCPAGQYGSGPLLVSPTCTSPCAAGCTCPAGSTTGCGLPCGNASVFCPPGSASPARVLIGWYSTGGTDASHRTKQSPCVAGSFCVAGATTLCPDGFYGASTALVSAACTGVCSDGYTCPAGSVAPTAVQCSPGGYCSNGTRAECPVGTFNESPGGASLNNCTKCAAGSANPHVGQRFAASCEPCTPPEDCGRGASVCWPGIVSVVASNPPPVVPMLSVGDVVTFTFSKPTNAPQLTAAGVSSFVRFSSPIGSVLAGTWSYDATAFAVTIQAAVPGGVNISGTRIGALSVALNASVRVTDASGASGPAVYIPASVTGDWGVARVPEFLPHGGTYAPSYARNTGGQAGLGVGDSLLLRFTTPCWRVPVASSADVRALLEFSPPIGVGYSGQWVISGPFADTSLIIVVTEALPADRWNATATAVGALRVSVRASAGMTSLDNSTSASNASTVIALGSWGEVPSITAVQRSCESLRVTLAPPSVTAYGWAAHSYRLQWSISIGFDDEVHSYNVTAVHADGTASFDVGGLPTNTSIFMRAAARARVMYVGEPLAPIDELGPTAAAPGAFVTQFPSITSVSIGGVGTLMAAIGGQVVVISGTWLGIDVDDVVVTYSNGKTTIAATRCSVSSPNLELTCATSPGVGFGFVFCVKVASATSCAPDAFTARYNAPVILDSVRVARDVFRLSGRDFGPVGTHVDAFLYSPSDTAVVFYAAECGVRLNDTTIECSAPDGAGANLLWEVVIGGQQSAAQTVAYAIPEIASVSCHPSPCSALDTLGDDVIRLRGANFGPVSMSPNFLRGAYGGVYFVASNGNRLALVGCNVTVSQHEAVCRTPAGFGVSLSVEMTVLRQNSAHSNVTVAYASPVISSVGAGAAGTGPFLVKGNTVIVHGMHLGAAASLLLDSVPVDAHASIEEGHARLVFRVSVLPLGLIGRPNISVAVRLESLVSNDIVLPAAPPSIAARFPLAIEEGRPAGACPSVTSAVFWVTLTGSNFGLDASTTSLTVTDMPDTSAICSITDLPNGGSHLVFGTNSSTGSIAVTLRTFTTAAVVFSADTLLLPPTIIALQNVSYLTPTALGALRTGGGDVIELAGANFHASNRVFIGPRDVLPARLPPEARFTLPECSVVSISVTAIQCEMPPGVGALHPIALFARGAFTSSTLSVSYAAPVISGIEILVGTTELSNAGGDIRVLGSDFGTQADNVTVQINGMSCVNVRAVAYTTLTCKAPACDVAWPLVAVDVGGQLAQVAGLLRYSPPVIDSISPRTSRTRGGGDLLLFGSNFGASVPHVVFVLPYPLARFDAVVLQWNQTRVVVRVPPGASGGGTNGSLVSLELGTTMQVTRLESCFEYLPPSVTSVAPPGSTWCSVDGCVLTVSGDNFGSLSVLKLIPPSVMVNDRPCSLITVDDATLSCLAPPGSGVRNSLSVAVLNRTAVVSETAFAYSRPSILYAVPSVVNQRVETRLLLMGSNFAMRGLRIIISGVECTTADYVNSSAVSCRAAQFLAIGVASVTVAVDGLVSDTANVVAECAEGFFGRSGDGACMPCPVQAICNGHGAEPLARAGYWRSGRTAFVACIPAEACEAGAPGRNDSACALAYTGVECRKCAHTFYRLGTACVPCPQNAWVLLLLFVAVVVCSGALAAWMHRKMFNIKGLTIGVDMMQVSRVRQLLWAQRVRCSQVAQHCICAGDVMNVSLCARRRFPCSPRSILPGQRCCWMSLRLQASRRSAPR